jgi:cation diffusion facilitator family transporter
MLGLYLVKTGKNNKSLIIEANGRHILTDAWTSAGAIAGLLLAYLTGSYWIDPLMALFFGANIIFEGGKLIRRSIQGLMDKTDPELFTSVQNILSTQCSLLGITYHRLRLRMSGNIVYIDFHLQFPDETTIESAHLQATQIEQSIQQQVAHPCDIVTHLESTSHHPPDHV